MTFVISGSSFWASQKSAFFRIRESESLRTIESSLSVAARSSR